jgi:hypothetical protein
MANVYNYDETTKVLVTATPLITQAELLAICKEVDEETPTTELDLFIGTAHIIVCEHLDGYGISTERLTIVERYLAAHYSAVTYTPSVFESVGKVQVSYSTKLGLGLDLTRYGQQAMSLDPTGNLKKMDKATGKRAMISWLGMTEEEWEASANANTQEST